MNRRAFVSGSLLALAAPLAAEAQQTKVYRIGALLQGAPLPGNPPGPLRLAMRELGYIEGQNLIVDFRWGEGRNDLFPRLAAELVALKPDAIFADSTPAALAAKRATATIPIVIHNVSDPVGSGLVVSLAHPGGNVTGVTDFGSELAVKGLELLHTLVPKAARIAVLMSDNPVHPSQLRLIQDAAQGLGLTVLPTILKSSEEFETAFSSMARQNAGALILLGGAPFSTVGQRDKLVALAARTKLPTMYPSRWWVDVGGLLGYGPSAPHKIQLVAACLAKILKGARPADLPVEQPSKFELVINAKTASALG